MNSEKLLSLLQQIQAGKLAPEEALSQIKHLPYENLGFAKPDTHRALRTGFPEIIFCEGKTPEQVVSIGQKLYQAHSRFVATRVTPQQTAFLKKKFKHLTYRQSAKMVFVGKVFIKKLKQGITILTAGTSDIPVAEEAALMAELMGNRVEKIFDVGVAGVHRLLDHRAIIEKSNILIVVAGMEGALPSLVAGLYGKPVIAVPTSVGYGASFGGVSALLTMLNTCALGISVVNIDNGLGAGYLAALLNHG